MDNFLRDLQYNVVRLLLNIWWTGSIFVHLSLDIFSQ